MWVWQGAVVNDKFSLQHVELKIPLGLLSGYIMLTVDIQVWSLGEKHLEWIH